MRRTDRDRQRQHALIVLAFAGLLAGAVPAAWPHPGGMSADGCHTERATGTRHTPEGAPCGAPGEGPLPEPPAVTCTRPPHAPDRERCLTALDELGQAIWAAQANPFGQHSLGSAYRQYINCRLN